MIWHSLTCVLIVLKLMELIHISWWWVFTPSLAVIVISLVIVFGIAWSEVSKLKGRS